MVTHKRGQSPGGVLWVVLLLPEGPGATSPSLPAALNARTAHLCLLISDSASL